MSVRTGEYVCDDFVSKPRFKAGTLGKFLVVPAAFLCLALPSASIEDRRLEYYSVLFFPFALLATCVIAAFGRKMLFCIRVNPTPETFNG